MRPYINDYFQYTLHISNWQIMLCLGILAALILFRILCTKLKISDKTYNFYLLTSLLSIVAGLLSATVFQAFYNWRQNGKFEFRGMTVMGGLLGASAVFITITVIFGKEDKRHFYRIANIAAPCIAAAHCLGRIGCFLAGCCYGKETDSPLGVLFVYYSSHERLPTQLFEAIFLAILFILTVIILIKSKKNIALIIYLYSYSVFRFIIEFYRDDDRGAFFAGLSPSQLQSVFMLLIAVALTVYVYALKRTPFVKQKNAAPPEQIETDK